MAESHAHGLDGPGAVIAVEDPWAAAEALARARRARLAAPVVGITGSNGKTTTKDLLAALLPPTCRVSATADSFNTRLGVIATVLGAPAGVGALLVEMGMVESGQIAGLAATARPTVGVITNVGPAHLAPAGGLAGVAAAKAELIAALPSGAACVVPAAEPRLRPHLRADLRTITFGARGEVRLVARRGRRATIAAGDERHDLELPFEEPHNVANLVTAVAAAYALGHSPVARPEVARAPLRGETLELPSGATLVLDCFNANPGSMEAALVTLARAPARRRVAVLGLMVDLGAAAEPLYRAVGARAAALGVDALVLVGPEAAACGPGFAGPVHPVADPREAAAVIDELAGAGDRVLVKASRSARLERIAERWPRDRSGR